MAGATHAPITAILIIFEMTNNYSIILPLMLVCVISLLVSTRLSRESIYTIKLVRRGIDLFRGRSLDLLKDFKVSQCLRRDYESVSATAPMKEVMERILRAEHTHFYVVHPAGRFQGIMTLGTARRVLLGRGGLDQVLLAEDLTHTEAPLCTPDESLSPVLPKFAASRLPELPVVNNLQEQKLCGVIHYPDVARLYQEEILKMDTAGGFARAASASTLEPVELARGLFLTEWNPPSSLWGRTLKDCRLPATYGLYVVLVKKKTGADATLLPILPGPDYVVAENDALIVCGSEADIKQAGKL
ncbi:MAG: CBS domain-containing protein [Verrucomicrobia bacterium]|nr:CBS domain-containing protein [Verrucomicrobiota bacterium]